MYYEKNAKSFLIVESRFVWTSMGVWCRASGNNIHWLRTVLGSTVSPRTTLPLNSSPLISLTG